jgi:hypothetical protein
MCILPYFLFFLMCNNTGSIININLESGIYVTFMCLEDGIYVTFMCLERGIYVTFMCLERGIYVTFMGLESGIYVTFRCLCYVILQRVGYVNASIQIYVDIT